MFCGVLLLVLGLVVNLLGINLLKYFVNVGIVVEVIVFIGIGVLLLLFFCNYLFDLLFSGLGGIGDVDGFYLDGVLIVLVVGGWVFFGFDVCL